MLSSLHMWYSVFQLSHVSRTYTYHSCSFFAIYHLILCINWHLTKALQYLIGNFIRQQLS